MRAWAITLPSSSAAMALTDDVPMSRPTVTGVIVLGPRARVSRRGEEMPRGRRRAATRSWPLRRRRRPGPHPVRSVKRPPASSTITRTAARSQSARPPTSTAMSIEPSATITCDQKSPNPRVRPQRSRQRQELAGPPDGSERADRVVGQLGVAEFGHLRHRHRLTVAERAPARARPPPGRERGRRHHADCGLRRRAPAR